METWKEVLINIRKDYKLSPKRELDQFFATPETSLNKAKIMIKKDSVDNKNILILGDDDLVSLCLCFLANPKSITVVEVDPKIADAISKESQKRNFPVKVVKNDIRNISNLKTPFDSAIFDPPYTAEGVTLFLKSALENLSQNPESKIFLCFGAGPKNLDKILRLQEILNSFYLVTDELIKDFNEYENAPGIQNKSSLYILSRSKKTDFTNVQTGISEIYTHNTPPIVKLPPIFHFSVLIFDIKDPILTKRRILEGCLVEFCKELELNWISKSYSVFKGGGFTYNFVLKQSNLSAHTWKEFNLLHLDLLVCQEIPSLLEFGKIIPKIFKTERYILRRLE